MIKVNEQFAKKMVEEGKFNRIGDYLLIEKDIDPDVDLDGWNPSKNYEGFKLGDEIEDENDVVEYWDGSELLKDELYHRDFERVREVNKEIDKIEEKGDYDEYEQTQKVLERIKDIPLIGGEFGYEVDYKDEKYWNELTDENVFVLS